MSRLVVGRAAAIEDDLGTVWHMITRGNKRARWKAGYWLFLR
jgi:hypothetical protein